MMDETSQDDDYFTCIECGSRHDESMLFDNCSEPKWRICVDCCECDWRTDEEIEEEHEAYFADMEYHRLKEFEEDRY